MITKDSSGANLSQAFIDAVSQPLVNFDMRLFSGGSDTGWSVKRAQVDLGAGASEEDQLADFQIGSVYTSQMEAQLNGATGQVVGRDVEVRVGVFVNGSYQYVTIAHMTVVSAREWMGTTTVRCVGVMSALNVLLGVSEGDYTPAQVRDAIQSASGVSVALGSFGSTSTTVSIEEGSTCRQALEQLALRLGGFAAETHDGGIRVAPFSSSTTYALDSDRIRQAPDIALSDFVADGLDVRTPSDTFTFGTGRVRAYDETATSSTSSVIWSNIQGYSYRPGSVMVGIVDPRVTPFDVASVKGAALPTRGISVTYDGGYFGRYSAAGLTADAVDSLVRGSLTKAVDDVATTALDAKSASQIAQSSAASALASANSAQASADAAQASATAAGTAASNAQRDATAAGTAAANAQRDATRALQDAAAASTAASNAQTSADNAAAAASNAATAASNAQTSADNAQRDATRANNAANDALNQLSVIEDVSGTLAWISEHGSYTATTDTSVQADTVYFEKQGSDYVPITNPTGNPQAQGWYVLDISDSQSEYIMAHLAVTSKGLWVLPSGIDGQTPATSSGYKVLLSNTGMTVYNASGVAVANYGSNVTIGQVGAAHVVQTPTEKHTCGPDGNIALVTRYESVSSSSSSEVKYGTRITNSANRTFINITPKISAGVFTGDIGLSATLDTILLKDKNSEAQLNLGSYVSSGGTALAGNLVGVYARKTVGGVEKTNSLLLNVNDTTGDSFVSLDQTAWLTALGLNVETIYETSVITIKRFGRMIMVQCHGVSGTANNNVPLANVDMSAYKPSYNASTIVCDTQSTTHFARLWVSAGDGKPYLAFAGYSGASTWYGTLTYVY